jgi:hypothetical protein
MKMEKLSFKSRIGEWFITEDVWTCYLFSVNKKHEGEISFPFNYIFFPLFWYADIKNKMGWFIILNLPKKR